MTIRSMSARSIATILCAAGCAGSGERFEVKYASDFEPAPMSASIFGVLRDGLMREDGAAMLGAAIFRAFQNTACELAYDDKLGRSNPELFGYLDKRARDDGITDDLLEKVAGHAKGDFIVAFQMFGAPPGHGQRTSAPTPVLLAHGGDAHGPSPYPRSSPHKAASAFEVSATLFSLRLHRTVASLRMEYSGGSVADAMNRFADKLAATFSNLTCAGWNLPSGVLPTEEPDRRDDSASPRALL